MENLANAELHAPVRFRFRDIWKGPDGLRTGWAILAFYLIYAGVIFAIGCLVHERPLCQPLNHDDAKVKIAPVHSDCECSFWLRSLMGSAG